MLAEPKRRGRPPKNPQIPAVPAEELRDAKRNAAEQGAEAVAVTIEPAQPAPQPRSFQPLVEFIASIEGARLAEGVVLTRVTHPDAEPGLYAGQFSGVITEKGPLSALFSDGSTFQPDA